MAVRGEDGCWHVSDPATGETTCIRAAAQPAILPTLGERCAEDRPTGYLAWEIKK